MRILMLYSEHSKGVVDYTNHISEHLLTDQATVKLPKLHVHDQTRGRGIMQDIIDRNEHDVLHIQYDNNMFATDRCPFEQLENFVWLVDNSINNRKRVVVTLHGIHQYKSTTGLINKLQLKLLSRYWRNNVIPAWNKCDLIVHSYNHKHTLRGLGCDTNVHVVSPSIKPHGTVTSSHEADVRVVIPGKRSAYKNYDQAFELLSLLPDNYHMYISDQGDVTDTQIANRANIHKIIDRLHLVTFSSNKSEYRDQLASYDVAVLPYTDNVPSSGSLQDCLSVMLPCLTSNTQSFREFNNKHACIIPCGCIVNTGNMLIRRVTQDTQYADMLRENIKQYHQDRAPAKVRQQLFNIYTPPVVKCEDIKHDTINVFMCCRDNQDTLQHTLDNLVACEQNHPGMKFKYYILENDSVDSTPDIIQKFYETNKGDYSCNVFGNTKWASEPGAGRMRDMARYRNMMKLLCSEWTNSQYSFIVDSEIQFDVDITSKQIKYLQQHADVVMVTPYGTVGTSDVYYDQFAYRDMNNAQDITNVKSRVRSAFAGFACIRTPVLQRCEWSCVDGDTSEHVPFCDMVRRHGDIAIDREVRVRW